MFTAITVQLSTGGKYNVGSDASALKWIYTKRYGRNVQESAEWRLHQFSKQKF